ncbi:hypothetical protein GWI33_017860 [Rhynchophorus ferrugineus]|uniref:Uncharacterized protein n=1 Tax=Rhynchophorus ferrugineus TaxID=354439 RepID=A0A834M228_RHYFE|nr:hypothetical protein GWI33_017860 [Rhynchophorus ferrugineus]
MTDRRPGHITLRLQRRPGFVHRLPSPLVAATSPSRRPIAREMDAPAFLGATPAETFVHDHDMVQKVDMKTDPLMIVYLLSAVCKMPRIHVTSPPKTNSLCSFRGDTARRSDTPPCVRPWSSSPPLLSNVGL